MLQYYTILLVIFQNLEKLLLMKCHSYLKCAFKCDNFYIREHTTHILKHDIHIFYSNLIRSVYSCLNANTI